MPIEINTLSDVVEENPEKHVIRSIVHRPNASTLTRNITTVSSWFILMATEYHSNRMLYHAWLPDVEEIQCRSCKSAFLRKKIWRIHVLFLGPLIPLTLTSGNVYPGFHSEGRFLTCRLSHLRTMDSSDSPLV